ncbi:Hpt domain-containing protein [Caldimonas aquatica]|uniref:Hpt domain-containing protein n=1 Tax=Caldimonas aquatica TaxID=376175 RepID=A0ABY6MUU0_9BURK|nr:Hpt domain-containing protein [Schlegelella aquatica]UZD55775.1 Hpt domain-containing protein [Schlegelella aquatica]
MCDKTPLLVHRQSVVPCLQIGLGVTQITARFGAREPVCPEGPGFGEDVHLARASGRFQPEATCAFALPDHESMRAAPPTRPGRQPVMEPHMFVPDPSVFDGEALARLRELDPKGESRLLERLFRTFQSSLDKLIPQMLNAHKAGDLATMRLTAHTLKSSSASVGAARLSASCAELEAAIRAGGPGPFDRLVEAVRQEAARVHQSLEGLLGSD